MGGRAVPDPLPVGGSGYMTIRFDECDGEVSVVGGAGAQVRATRDDAEADARDMAREDAGGHLPYRYVVCRVEVVASLPAEPAG